MRGAHECHAMSLRAQGSASYSPKLRDATYCECAWPERAGVLVQPAIATVLEAEQLQRLFGPAASDSVDHTEPVGRSGRQDLTKIEKVRQRVRRHVRTLLSRGPAGSRGAWTGTRAENLVACEPVPL